LRFVIRLFSLISVALLCAAIVVLALCLQDRPLVTGAAQLAAADIERAKRVISSQPRRQVTPDGSSTLTIDEGDLAVALNYLASRLGQVGLRVSLRPGEAGVQASVEVPSNPVGRYLNIDAAFRQSGAPVPRLDRLKIGRLQVPGLIADYLLSTGWRWLITTEGGQVAASAVQKAKLGDGRLIVTYRWTEDIAAAARSVLVAPDDEERLRVYQTRLAEVVARAPRAISLAKLMPPLFQLALERGAAGDPVRENRAAIVILALYAVGESPDRLVPAAATWRRPARRSVILLGRNDFPKHFLVSAAIAVEAGNPLADLLGLQKEVDDSRGGSGFSFNDIAANRAGTRFGEIATLSPPRAQALAQAVAAGVVESDFMPAVADLPEFLPEAEFKRRYGGVGGAGYERLIAEIDRRIAALPLLRR
jgi:hypothetical protein